MYYDPNYIEWGAPQGWRCPGCGRYYSPTTPMCFYCGGNQKTWTSPTTTSPSVDDSEWWKEYLKQSQTGTPVKDNPSTTTASTTTDKNVVVTAHNSDYTVTCKHSCGNCDKYNKSCFGGIETTASKTIISHRKPLDIHYPSTLEEWFEVFNNGK